MKKIMLKELYPTHLEMSFTAENLFKKYINNLKEENHIILDFTGITFMSLSFTQEYVYQKKHTSKIIKEINMSQEIMPMLQLVQKRIGGLN